MTKDRRRRVMHGHWLEEGRARFGDDPLDWAFVCPCCGHVATVREWRAAGAIGGQIAFSCIGRYIDGPVMEAGPITGGPTKGPCNYAGGGLFRMNPVEVAFPNGAVIECFEWADERLRKE